MEASAMPVEFGRTGRFIWFLARSVAGLAVAYLLFGAPGLGWVKTIPLPGERTVELGAGHYELRYQSSISGCKRELQQDLRPTEVAVTSLTEGRLVPLEAVANPIGSCNHATWYGTVYRFEVSQPGLYKIAGQSPADPSRKSALVIIEN
jgi:hypothetical protein